jgi:tetratricopeptide (TPR) repeat protein
MTMRKTPNLLVLLALTGAVTAVACGGEKTDIETSAEPAVIDPAKQFKIGVQLLSTPDKNGDIDYAGAYEAFEMAVAEDPSLSKAQFNAGWAAERLGRTERAEQHYRAAIEADPNYKNALYNLGNMLMANDRPGEAAALYENYVAIHPDDLAVRNNLMEALNSAEMYDAAISQAGAILLLDPENVGTYRNLSRTYFAKGELAMSQLCAEKAKTLNEGDPGLYNNMGVTFLLQGDEISAIENFQIAVKLDNDNLEANMNLGWVALRSGDYVLARTAFEAATSAAPGNIDAKLGMAIALRGAKEYDAAAKIYEQVLSVDPKNEMAYFNAATLHKIYTKDYKKAQKYLDRYIDVMEGSIGPNHEVFVEKESILEAQAEEKKRQDAIAQKKKEEEERQKRQMAQLDTLKARNDAFKAKMQKAHCPDAIEMGVEELSTVTETADMVIASEDFQMAGDVLTFFDQYEPMLDQLVELCPEGGAAPSAEEPTPQAEVEGADSDTAAPGTAGDEAPADGEPTTPE